MQLDENYYLDSDSNQWILRKEEVTDTFNEKTGKYMMNKDTWYFPKITQALSRYLDDTLKGSENVTTVLERIKEVEESIQKLEINANKK